MDLMTIEEVARVLRVREERAYQLARDGLLPAVRVGRQVRVDRCALRQWIERGGQGLKIEGSAPWR